MKWARIENGVVIEVTNADPTGRFTQELVNQFSECPENVEQNWTYENGIWSEPSEQAKPTIEELLKSLDDEYQPSFLEITRAWANANMDGNSEQMETLKTLKSTLTDEYLAKKEVIENG